jgi:hypothetical protein
MTYRQLADQLGVSLEAARRRALRAKWARMPSNDGRTFVRPPNGWKAPISAPVAKPSVPDNSALVIALRDHVETLKADNERLEAQLVEANGRTDKAIASLASLADRLDVLAAERARPWWRRLTDRF